MCFDRFFIILFYHHNNKYYFPAKINLLEEKLYCSKALDAARHFSQNCILNIIILHFVNYFCKVFSRPAIPVKKFCSESRRRSPSSANSSGNTLKKSRKITSKERAGTQPAEHIISGLQKLCRIAKYSCSFAGCQGTDRLHLKAHRTEWSADKKAIYWQICLLFSF